MLRRKFGFAALLGLWTVCALLLGSAFSQTDPQPVTVAVDFGPARPYVTKTVPWKEGLTALRSLQSIARVETKKYHNWTLVKSVDGVASDRGATAWFYDVNGENPAVMPDELKLKPGDFVRWIFMADYTIRWLDNKIWPGKKGISVSVDYGVTHPYLFTTIAWTEGLTALQAIQKVAEVQTSGEGKNEAVESINGVVKKPGSMDWVFDVNDVPTGNPPGSSLLQPGDVLRWIYIGVPVTPTE